MQGFGSFARTTAKTHMTKIYAPMFLYCLLLHATLQDMWETLASDTQKKYDTEKNAEDSVKGRRKMSTFVNAYWFSNISSQMQGMEFFQLMRKQMPLDEEYQELLGQIDRGEDLASAERERKINDKQIAFGFFFGMIALMIASLDIMKDWFGLAPPAKEYPSELLYEYNVWVILLLAFLLSFFLSYSIPKIVKWFRFK